MSAIRFLLALCLAASSAGAQTIRLSAPAPLPVVAAVPVPALPVQALLVPMFPPALAAVPVLPAPAAPALSQPARPAEPAAEAEYAAMFDGAPLEGPEGERVSPRLAVAGEASLRLPLQAAVVRRAVELALPALRESVALGSWSGPRTTLDESCCGDAAPKLAAVLRARGIPARLVEAEFHYYVILDLPEGQLIVDPTVRQFFGRKRAPKSVPTVFVGTLGELRELFLRHQAAKTTRYDPQRIYFSQAETRESELRKVEAAIRLGGPRDLEPLRRFLGLPPAAPRLVL